MERNTPPIYSGDKQRKSELLGELVQMILDDPESPAELRMALQMGEAGKRIQQKICDVVFDTGLQIKPKCDKRCVERGDQLLEYLQLMEAGLDSFLAAFGKE